MKLEVIEKGVFGRDGKEVELGKEISVEGDKVPAYLVGKTRPVGRVAVTNPAEGAAPGGTEQNASGAERQELMKAAAIQISGDSFLSDGRPDVRAINDELTDEAEPFTADERDQLWPGIADAVKAERG